MGNTEIKDIGTSKLKLTKEDLIEKVAWLESQLDSSIKLQNETYLEKENLEKILEGYSEQYKEYNERPNLSIRGDNNLSKVVEALTQSGYTIVVELDDYQARKPEKERYYTVKAIHVEFEGITLTQTDI